MFPPLPPSRSANTNKKKARGRSFEKGNKEGKGRPKGLPNKMTTVLRDTIIIAAEYIGGDNKSFAGLVGYLISVGIGSYNPKTGARKADAFVSLLRATLPMQMNITEKREYKTTEEVNKALREAGLPEASIYDLEFSQEPDKPVMIDVTPKKLENG